eukprot:12418236-Alexandrium_andersonii.AAC.1
MSKSKCHSAHTVVFGNMFDAYLQHRLRVFAGAQVQRDELGAAWCGQPPHFVDHLLRLVVIAAN